MFKVGDSLTKFVIRSPFSAPVAAAKACDFGAAALDGLPNKWISRL